MKDHKRDVIEPHNWVPWIGLALVVPALLIMIIGFVGALAGSRGPSGGRLVFADPSSGSMYAMAALITVIGAVGGLMLAAVGIVRGMRRPAPHNGRSIGIAGFSLEIGVIIIAAAAIAILGFSFL